MKKRNVSRNLNFHKFSHGGLIQRNGKDSEGKPVESLKEAEEIASLIINQLVTDRIFSQVVQEAIDGERFSPTE